MGDQERGVDWVDFVDQIVKDGAHKPPPREFFQPYTSQPQPIPSPTPVPAGTTVVIMQRDPYHGVVTKKTIIEGQEPGVYVNASLLLVLACAVFVAWVLHRVLRSLRSPAAG